MMNAQAFPSVNHLFPQRFMHWQARGLSARAASAVSLAACDTVEDIAHLGRTYFEDRPNCAEKTLAELATLAGWPPKRSTAVEAIAAALRLAIDDPDEAVEAATDALIGLRRSGYVVIASRTAPESIR